MLEDSGVTTVLAMRNTIAFLPEVRGVTKITMDNFWVNKSDVDYKKFRTMTRDDITWKSSAPSHKPLFQRGASMPLAPMNSDAPRVISKTVFQDDSKDLAYIIFTSGSTGRFDSYICILYIRVVPIDQ
jgi:hypothetical protein